MNYGGYVGNINESFAFLVQIQEAHQLHSMETHSHRSRRSFVNGVVVHHQIAFGSGWVSLHTPNTCISSSLDIVSAALTVSRQFVK